MLIDHLGVGGAQRHTALLAERLAADGHSVVIGHSGTAEVMVAPTVTTVELLAERISRTRSSAFTAASLRLARAFRPTIVHAHLFAGAIAGAAVSRNLGVPLILSHHSAGSWQGPEDRALVRSAVRQSRLNLVASPQLGDALERDGVPRDAIWFLPNAVEVPRQPSAHRAAGRQLRAGYLARFSTDKNPVAALQAVATARSSGVPVTLQMAGDGELRQEVDEAITRLRLDHAVRRLGFVDDVSEFLSGVDLLLLSSRSEGMPLAILEAMANEVPVLATRVGAVPLEVNDGVTGLLVEPGDSRALSRGLSWMHQHPGLRRRMGRAGRDRLLRQFSLDRMLAQVTAAYRRAAQRATIAAAS
jgi:glycosyltransferase involved in cell wall biosynthesis